jgi:CTP synthase
MVGKYMDLQDSYLSVNESIVHGGIRNDCEVEVSYIDAEDIERDGPDALLSDLDGILVPGGFGDRGTEGKIIASQYARENNVPYFGLCLGMQIAVIDFARNQVGLTDANSTEFNTNTPHPVIDIMGDQKEVKDKGATMRLGACPCVLKKDSLASIAYGKEEVTERHRHRFEFNNEYRQQLEEAGLIISGVNPDRDLVEIIEVKGHPWFVAVQFHPEFQSKPNKAHPLFASFIEAALARKLESCNQQAGSVN